MTRIESLLTEALADTARRNLPDATVPPPFRPAPELPHRVRPWALPALAAAVVVALAVSVLALTDHGRNRTHRVPAGTTSGSFVTLRARSSLSAAQLDQARLVLIARAVALGAPGGEVRVVGSDEITLSLPGVAAADVGDLGAPYALNLRPLLINQSWHAAPTPAPSGALPVVDPWKSLGFPPPTDAAGYQALSPVQRNAVQAVVKNWDCRNASPDLASAPIVACDRTRTAKYLLGAAIVTGDQLRSATEVNSGIGSVGWGVNVDLAAAGQQQWASYTAQHNEQVHPGADANVFAVTVDNAVIQASTLQEAITGTTEIVTGLTQRAASRLAGFLTAGRLPAPFDVVSVRSN